MGYILTIGEADITWGIHGVEVKARPEQHEAAPSFDDRSNRISVSYTFWRKFCDTANIGSVMYDTAGDVYPPLIHRHPGHVRITSAHVECIEARIRTEIHAGPEDINRQVSEWLVYWIRWALENCERPAFVNA